MMTTTTTATATPKTLPPAWGAYEYMAEADRVARVRVEQGWDADPEYGWGGQCPITKQWLREGDATYEGSGMDLHLFHRIALASCAMHRARIHVMNNERWDGEYYTARLWGGQ